MNIVEEIEQVLRDFKAMRTSKSEAVKLLKSIKQRSGQTALTKAAGFPLTGENKSAIKPERTEGQPFGAGGTTEEETHATVLTFKECWEQQELAITAAPEVRWTVCFLAGEQKRDELVASFAACEPDVHVITIGLGGTFARRSEDEY